VWDVTGIDTFHVGFNNISGEIDFEIDDAYFECDINYIDSIDVYLCQSEVVSVTLSNDRVYVIEYRADDSSAVNINTGYTVENGCHPTFSHYGIPALPGSYGQVLVFNDHVDTMLYWYDSFGVLENIYPPGDYFVYPECGDANGDDQINVGDAVFIINYVFKGGEPPDPLCEADANGDGDVNVADAVYLINFVFKGGNPPVDDCCLP
jgi:hypothetical protein